MDHQSLKITCMVSISFFMVCVSGDKPYRCNECGVRFADSGNFSKHKKTKHGDTAKNVYNSKMSALANTSDAISNSDLTAAADVTQLPDFSRLSDMTKMSEYARMNVGSMGKVVGAAKMAVERNFMTAGDVERTVSSAVASASHSLATSSSSLPQQRASPPSDIADFKSLVPPMGMDQPLSAVPHHLSTPLQVGSPPALPVQNQMSASPVMSPTVSIPPQSSPVPSASNDSRISPMPQPAHQIQDYRVPQHDGVVFPPHYYNNYPYYYQQQ